VILCISVICADASMHSLEHIQDLTNMEVGKRASI